AVDTEVPVTVTIRAHDRSAGRHRFEQGKAQPLVPRGLQEHGGPVDELVPRGLRRSREVADSLTLAQLWLDAEQPELGPRLGKRVPGLDCEGEVLQVVAAANREDDSRFPLESEGAVCGRVDAG